MKANKLADEPELTSNEKLTPNFFARFFSN